MSFIWLILTVKSSLSLTVITLTVGVIHTTVFEYKNQVMFNMTVFDGEPRCQIDTFFVYKQKRSFFEGGSRCQTKNHLQYDYFVTVGIVVILKLPFGIQTKTSFLKYQKQVIFQYNAF